MRAVVAAGFGGFLAHGGGALDQYALGGGAQEGDAKARVAALGGMEHGVLSIGGYAAAIIVLATGRGQPALDCTLPWAILPVPGFLIRTRFVSSERPGRARAVAVRPDRGASS